MSNSETSFAEQMARRSLEALEQKYPGSTGGYSGSGSDSTSMVLPVMYVASGDGGYSGEDGGGCD